ncbi:hypothetical protein ACFLTH_12140 [Bacteroidota bacterium]
MDPKKAALIKDLVNKSKSGENSAFLNLIKLFIDDIYRISLKLTLTNSSAEKLSISSVLDIWKDIYDYNEQVPFRQWLLQSIATTYHNAQSSFAVFDNGEEELIDLTSLEKEFSSFTRDERVILFLLLELEYNESKIIRVLPDIMQEEIDEIIHRRLPQLASSSHLEDIGLIPQDDWDQIIMLMNKEANDEKLNMFLEMKFIKEDYEMFKMEFSDSFSSFNVPQSLLGTIKDTLSENLSTRRHHDVVEEEVFRKKVKEKKHSEIFKSRPAPRKVKRKKERKSINEMKWISQFRWSYIIITLVVLGLLVSGYFILFGVSSCKIINVRGVYRINGFQDDRTNLDEGDVILTTAGSNLTLDFPSHGKMMLMENSSVQVLANYVSELKVRIIQGKITCKFVKPSEQFNVSKQLIIELITDIGVINTNDSDFSVSLDQNKPIRIDASRGYTAVTDNRNNIFHLGKGYVLTQSQGRFITPYNVAAKAQLKGILESVQSNISGPELISILNLSTDKDLLTLWHLLPISGRNDRERIITKINEFTFMPFPEIQRKAIRLDAESLIYILNLLMINYL